LRYFIVLYLTENCCNFEKTASALDFAYTAMDRLYWLDDNLCSTLFTPGLRLVSVTWLSVASTDSHVTLIDISFWLIDTTRQFMLRDAHAIALDGALSDLSSSRGAVGSRF
jgi:hypothetical protein